PTALSTLSLHDALPICDLMTLMTTYGPKDAASLTFTAAGEKFSSGRAAMMFDTSGFGTIFVDPRQSKVVGKVGFTLPKGPAGKRSEEHTSELQSPYDLV